MQCVFLFRLDLSLHAGADFFFEILNYATKQGPNLKLPLYAASICGDMKVLGVHCFSRRDPYGHRAMHACSKPILRFVCLRICGDWL